MIMKTELNLKPEILNARHMLGRRDFLQVGMLGGLGLTLPELLRTEARAEQKHYESKEGQAKPIIHIFLPGGMAHQESFDPKPYAPLEYRGPSGNIATKLAGVRFGEMFKETAKVADKITITLIGKDIESIQARLGAQQQTTDAAKATLVGTQQELDQLKAPT